MKATRTNSAIRFVNIMTVEAVIGLLVDLARAGFVECPQAVARRFNGENLLAKAVVAR